MMHSCRGTVEEIGRHVRAIHEAAIHGRAVKQWPDGMARAREWAEVGARYRVRKELLMRAIADMLLPIEEELGPGSHEETEMRLDQLASRLPEALRTLEAVNQPGRKLASEVAVKEAAETLQFLVEQAFGAVFSPGVETTLPVGSVGRGGPSGSIGSVGLDHRDDQQMIDYLERGLTMGAFGSPSLPGVVNEGQSSGAGSVVESSRIPLEDRGRTAYTVQPASDPNVIGSDPDPLPAIPGLNPAVMQWVPVGLWAIRQLGKLIAQWRAK